MIPLATEPGELLPSLVPWLLLLLALVAIGGAVLYTVRRWLRDNEARSDDPGFTLQDLREMHRAGKLSDEEFERAKAAMIEQIQRAATRDANDEPAA